MKRTKFITIVALATAISVTACDQPEISVLVPTESAVEITVTEEIEAEETPSITPIVSVATTASEANDAEATTEEDPVSGGAGNTSSGSGSSGASGSDNTSGGGSTSGGSEGGNASGGSNGGSSGGGSTPTTTQATETTAAPTEATTTTTTSNKYARRACSSCGQQKLVDTPNYRYTTPAKTHEETTETWDYGIQHCTVQINWGSSAKELGDPPSITESFDRKVDTSGNVTDNSGESGATNRARQRAHDWLSSQGVSDYSGYFSWSTKTGSTDKVNYNKTTTTVVDEPEHEYECAAYVCDNCGHVETYGTPKQIR